jgi:hypothetical protein
MNVKFPVITAAAALATAAALSACGTATTPAKTSPPATSSPPAASASAAPSTPGEVAPMIIAIRLDESFSPDTVSLAAGQKFQVIVDPSVDVSGTSFPSGCSSQTAAAVNNGMLTVSCPSASSYLFTTEHAGSTVLSVSVRPHCGAGEACPQWIKLASLTITIT